MSGRASAESEASRSRRWFLTTEIRKIAALINRLTTENKEKRDGVCLFIDFGFQPAKGRDVKHIFLDVTVSVSSST